MPFVLCSSVNFTRVIQNCKTEHSLSLHIAKFIRRDFQQIYESKVVKNSYYSEMPLHFGYARDTSGY